MKKILYVWAIASAVAMFVAGCGDDVINVKNEEVYAVVDSLADTVCTKDNEGAFALVRGTGKMYTCKDGDWKMVNGEEAVHLRCQSEPLKDSIGYNIICDGDTIGTVYNGINGVSGKSGKNGTSCSMDTTKGVATLTCGDLKFTVKNGKDGEGCSLDTAAEKITCGSETFDINLKGVEVNTDSLKAVVVDSVVEYVVDTLETKLDDVKKEIVKALKDSTSELRKKIDEIVAKQLETNDNLEQTIKTVEKILTDVAENKKSIEGILENLTEIEKRIDALEGTCHIVDVKIENSVQKVDVKCGDDESVLEMLIPNKNLSVVYKKHVIVRFPVDNDGGHTDYGKEQWAYLKSANYKDFAEFNVLEVDSNTMDQTGKVFIAELTAKKNQQFLTVEEKNANTIVFNVARLEGDIEITNLISSYAQLRVSLDIKHNTTVKVVYNAYVNLDDSDTITIDFLTDYKGARVKELMKDSETDFAKASAQANKELVSALHISEKAEDYPALEHYLPSEIGLNEQFASYIWPTALLDKPEKQDFYAVYADYRKSFAENGDFNTALTEIYNGDELSMFMIDFITLSMNDNFAKCWYDWFGNENCEQYNNENGSLADVAMYKSLQGGYKDAYGLGKIDVSKIKKDTIVEVKGGYFTFFRYIYTKKIWHPIFRENIEKYPEDFGDEYAGACEGDNIGKELPITFGDMSAILTCEQGPNSSDWALKTNGNALCKGKKEGSYIKSLNGDYYRCEKSEKEGVAIIGVDVDEIEFVEGAPCTEENADKKLIVLPGDDDFYWCHDHVSGNDHDLRYRQLDPIEIQDYLDIVIPLQGGSKCDKADEGKTFVYNKSVTAKGNAICHDEHWVAQDMFTNLGVCDETVMKQHKIYYVDKEEWNVSTLTTWGYVKCDCRDYDWNDDDEKVYTDCEWTGASTSEVEIMNKYPGKDMACDAERVDNKEFTDDGEYICKGYFGSRRWAAPTDQEKCYKSGMAKTPTPKSDDGSAMHDNVYQYCVVGEGSNAKYFVKKSENDDWRSASDYLGSCTTVNGNAKNAKVLMYGFNESQIYYCCTASSCSKKYELSDADKIISVLNTIENGTWDDVGKKVQCLMNYEVLDENNSNTPKTASGVAYKYRGTAQIRSTAKEYVSHDGETWYELNSALGSTTYYTGSAKKPTDGWCYDPENVQTPTKKYDSDDLMIDNVARYCVKGNDVVVKTSANGAWETAAQHLGDCNAPDGQNYGAKILMEGYDQNRLYICEKENPNATTATWTGYAVYNEGVTALLDVVTDNNESDYAKLIRDVQCRMSYTMPSTPITSYDGSEYKYQGSAKNRAGQTKNYVSYDKEDWFELNDANGHALLKDGWCYDEGNQTAMIEYDNCSESQGESSTNKLCANNGVMYYGASINANWTDWLTIREYCAQKTDIVEIANSSRFCGVANHDNDLYCEFVGDGKAVGYYTAQIEGGFASGQVYKCVNNEWTLVDKAEERENYLNARYLELHGISACSDAAAESYCDGEDDTCVLPLGQLSEGLDRDIIDGDICDCQKDDNGYYWNCHGA